MSQHESLPSDLEGETVLYQAEVTGGEQVGDPDTAIVVTPDHLHARPLQEADRASALDFTLPLERVETFRCNGVLCRTMTIEAEGNTVTIPGEELDEPRFRDALVENTQLSNPERGLSLEKYGLCPCRCTRLGCLLVVGGIGLMLSVFGLLLGLASVGVGIGLITLVYVGEKVGEWRGANVWDRQMNGV